MGALGPEQQEQLRYQVTYHMYVAIGGTTVIHTEHWTCSWLKNTWNFASLFWIFLPFVDYTMLKWEKIPGSPRFSILQATKNWTGPENEARKTLRCTIYFHLTSEKFLQQYIIIITSFGPGKPYSMHDVYMHCSDYVSSHIAWKYYNTKKWSGLRKEGC